MAWDDARREVEEAISLAQGGRGNDALYAAERAIENYAADLLNITLTELRGKRRTGDYASSLLRRRQLISSEQSEFIDGFRRIRNVMAHPPFTIRFEGRSLVSSLKDLQALIMRQAAPLHAVATRDLYQTRPDVAAVEVATAMAAHDYTFVPVFLDGQPEGTVNERSVVELFGDADRDATYLERAVKDIMKPALPIRPRDATVHAVVGELHQHGAVLVQLRKEWGIFTIWDYTSDHSDFQQQS